MKSALIGHTGFVGSNLRAAREFTHLYNSGNIASLRGESFDLLVCAGARAEKWKANADPATDRAHIESLQAELARATVKRAVLVSTVDVYPSPLLVDEMSPIDETSLHAYGRHRLALEKFFTARFPTTILRLPGLFGEGLKKNAIYDLLHANQVEKLNPASAFQFYWLGWLEEDMERALEYDLALLNVATPPLLLGTIARELFGVTLAPKPDATPARYDFRSRHDGLWGRSDGYLRGEAEVMAALERFVKSQRALAGRARAKGVAA